MESPYQGSIKRNNEKQNQCPMLAFQHYDEITARFFSPQIIQNLPTIQTKDYFQAGKFWFQLLHWPLCSSTYSVSKCSWKDLFAQLSLAPDGLVDTKCHKDHGHQQKVENGSHQHQVLPTQHRIHRLYTAGSPGLGLRASSKPSRRQHSHHHTELSIFSGP